MNKNRYIFIILAFILGGNLVGQDQRALENLMRDRGEYYFMLSVTQKSEIQAINSICSVDATDGQTVVCYANQQQYDRLLQADYSPTLQTPPSLREEAKMWDGGDRATYEWNSYPTYSAYQTMMEDFPASTVDGRTCTLLTLGTLSSGRKIMGVRINNGTTAGKPKFLYSSTIHGDETTGWILMLRLIDELCTSTDTRIVNLIDNLDIFIFPNTNPDGTYYRSNNSVTGARRANANNVDMNRNYPDPHGSAHPDGYSYQNETQWFMQLAETYPFVMAANYHGGSQVMNYPWDNTYTRHADDAWWQYVSREYATLAQAVNPNYMTDENNGITNGADWYTIGGGRQDYMNGYHQCREITIECSTTKKPNASQLPSFWNYNHNAMLTFMEECLNGVHGFVYDISNNQPVDGVAITVQNHDDQYSIVSSHEEGDFHRPIKGGSYTFIFSKEGYETEAVEVTIADGQRVDLTINLTPVGYVPPVAYGPEYPWIPSNAYAGVGMGVAAQVRINGQNVERADYEVGAFCGNECRGNSNGGIDLNLEDWTSSNLGYFAFMNVTGNDGDVINFYLYDKASGETFQGECATTLQLVNGENVGVDIEGGGIFVLNFVTEQTYTKDILAYTQGQNDHYYLVASPVGTVSPQDVTNMLANSPDLYYFDQSAPDGLEWITYKPGEGATDPNFDLEAGKGYLYANSQDVELAFTGFPYSGDGRVTLTKVNGNDWTGWNLVGNPFAETAYIGRSFFRMNPSGNEIIASTGAIDAMEGVFVVANTDGETLTFSTEVTGNKQALVVNLTNENRHADLDRVIVGFGQTDPLPKMMLNRNHSMIYVAKGNANYAVVSAEADNGELPLVFKAERDGSYRLSIEIVDVTFGYLHLVDIKTGTDVDLLQSSCYTFDARTTDDANRFKLVYAIDGKVKVQ